MRLWSIHPKYLDSKGLVALWREGLLAQKVLEGKTKGYREHPQLSRFKKAKNPLAAIGSYLSCVAQEATCREYRFDKSKILITRSKKFAVIAVTSSQLRYETQHLLKKLQTRDPERFQKLSKAKSLPPHPLFYSKAGPVEAWEKIGQDT